MAKRPFYITLDPSQLTSSPPSDPVLALRALALLQNFHALRAPPTHCPLACVNCERNESIANAIVCVRSSGREALRYAPDHYGVAQPFFALRAHPLSGPAREIRGKFCRSALSLPTPPGPALFLEPVRNYLLWN